MGLRSRFTGSITHEAVTMTLSFIRSDKPIYTPVSIRPFSPCHPTQARAGRIPYHIRNPYPAFPGEDHNFHGCLYPFPHPVASGSRSVPMATDSGYSHPGRTYSGLPQCDSNPSISAKPAHNNSVESPPRNSEADIRDVGNSSSGHVCHSPQLASSPFYVSSSGASRTGDRCSVTRLAGKVDVHVFTIPTAKQNHSEAQDHLKGRGDTHSPHGCHNLGSTLTTSVCGPPMLLSVPPRPTVTTGICLERQVVPSACMGALIQHYQAAGFSREVSRLVAAPRRPSTNKMYNNS